MIKTTVISGKNWLALLYDLLKTQSIKGGDLE